MNENDELTSVLFRVSLDDPTDVYALFPAIPASPGQVTCYAHHGQHGSADLAAAIDSSRPATEDEYRALRRELESRGYRFRVTDEFGDEPSDGWFTEDDCGNWHPIAVPNGWLPDGQS